MNVAVLWAWSLTLPCITVKWWGAARRGTLSTTRQQMVSSKQRSVNTLRTIMLAHQHQGALPHLTAISTLFQNLLVQNASDEAWQLFHQVASLPLRTTKLEVSCVAQGQECDRRAQRGWCSHAQVEVPHTVQLDAVDQHLFDKGRRINGPAAASWWGQQLAAALNGVVVA